MRWRDSFCRWVVSMSIANFEIEEQDEWQGFCRTHGQYYERKYGCIWCKDDASDRAIQEQLDDQERDA